jgi:hypothetical protein
MVDPTCADALADEVADASFSDERLTSRPEVSPRIGARTREKKGDRRACRSLIYWRLRQPQRIGGPTCTCAFYHNGSMTEG